MYILSLFIQTICWVHYRQFSVNNCISSDYSKLNSMNKWWLQTFLKVLAIPTPLQSCNCVLSVCQQVLMKMQYPLVTWSCFVTSVPTSHKPNQWGRWQGMSYIVWVSLPLPGTLSQPLCICITPHQLPHAPALSFATFPWPLISSCISFSTCQKWGKLLSGTCNFLPPSPSMLVVGSW